MFWRALEAAARERGCPVNALVAEIDVARLDADQPPNLTSAIRQWLFRAALRIDPSEGRAAVGRMVEEQRRLDQLQLHDPKRALVVGDDVDARVSRLGRRCGERRLARARSRLPAALRTAASRRRDIPGPGSRRLCGRLTTAWLYSPSNSISENSPVRAISSISGWTIIGRRAAFGGKIVIRAEPVRAHGARRDRRLDHQPLAPEAPPRFLQVGIAAGFDGKRRHGRNAALGELGKIGLVAVPAQQRGRVDQRPVARARRGREARASADNRDDSPRRRAAGRDR